MLDIWILLLFEYAFESMETEIKWEKTEKKAYESTEIWMIDVDKLIEKKAYLGTSS